MGRKFFRGFFSNLSHENERRPVEWMGMCLPNCDHGFLERLCSTQPARPFLIELSHEHRGTLIIDTPKTQQQGSGPRVEKTADQSQQIVAAANFGETRLA